MESPVPGPMPAVGELRRALLAFYDAARRDLPWRGETDAYRILVSEVMLQQTRVETVLGYYGAWLERFPDVRSLAAAEPDEVMKAWEGLGYYRRARNLHAAARVVRESGDADVPSTYAALRALPGVGDYTAGAVASIAFGERVPAVDGNVRRVLARLYDVAEPTARWLRRMAAELVDPERPGDWNQALMELGATVCTPRAPRCGECPVRPECAADARGTAAERPAPVRKKAPRRALIALAVLRHGGRVLLERRPANGLLAGMWAFPEVEVERPEDGAAAVRGIAERFGWAAEGEPAGISAVQHRFTHVHATYLPWVLDVHEGGVPIASPPDHGWVDAASAADLAIPVAQRRVLRALTSHRSEDAAEAV